jgi:hypothetical protein
MTTAATIVLVPAGESNFSIDFDRVLGPLADDLPRRSAWERQVLVEAALKLTWRFSHQSQLDGEGGAIELTFERVQ